MLTELRRPPPADDVVMWTFLRSLSASRLLPEDDVELLRRQFASCKAQLLFDMLVEEGMLTPYQLQRVRDGKGRGLVLGQYRILEELGQGGFGQVFKARHAIMNRLVALKLIASEWVQEPEIRRLFLREMEASTRLVHPNIALAYDANEIDGELFLAMEFVEGPTLEKYVTDRGPLPVGLACAVVRQTADALHAAHDCGMVHRDIKPANIMLPGLAPAAQPPATAGRTTVLVKIVDFGLARLYPRGTRQSATLFCKEGDVVGSPAFMSPEQLRNIHDVDIRGDLYSLGCTFYFALTGRPPFQGVTTRETFAMHQERDPEPIQKLRPDVPDDIAAVVQRLMAKKPDDRFATPAELAAALAGPRTALWLGEADRPPAAAEEPPTIVDGTDEEVALADTAVHDAPRPPEPEAPAPVEVPAAAPPAAPPAEVARLWREWSDAFASVARRDTPVSELDYRARHRALIQALRGEPPPGAPAGLYERAQALAEAWLSRAAVADLDGRSLAGLVRECRRLELEFMPPDRPRGGRAWINALAFALAAAAAGLLWLRVLQAA